ncbi:G-type lectin S-receptor-like serine/threonine-protein kinase LECRK3 [Silene latifolia]|uniref:G-type lectin S-receptor-like serine/threonine-protein kinase LECRK3 n=1 Tax=Silene latifolia TaxID=37657 RepID=UPI003D786689
MAWPLPCTFIFSLSSLILLQSSPVSSENDGKISVNQPLLATTSTTKATSLLSPSGDFAFGFHPIPNNSYAFLLAIWYAKIPDTIVWYANQGNPVPQGSKLKITVSEGLTLTDPQGTQLWNTSSELNGVGAVSYGFMNDTGNFELKSSDKGDPLWQSFDHPTDTLLPTQVMVQGQAIYSRLSETNFSTGKFQLKLQTDGNLILSTRDLTTGYAYRPYYASGTYDFTNRLSQGQTLVYNESGGMFIVFGNGSTVDVISDKPVSVNTFYQRVTLNFDGVLTWTAHPKTSSGSYLLPNWSTSHYIPDNLCRATPSDQGDSGACGFNSICRLDENHRPICGCPTGYALIDPSNTQGDCLPEFKLDGTNQDEYKFVELEETGWYNTDIDNYEQLDPCSEELCKSSCLNDYFCAAVVMVPNNTCLKKKLPLSYTVQDSGLGMTTWLKIGNINSSDDLFPVKGKNRINKVTKALFGSSVSVNLILVSAIGLILIFVCKKKSRKGDYDHLSQTLHEFSSTHCFTYKELVNATNGFQEELGRGAFGVVYKGKIQARDSSTIVAVKKLDRISQSADKEFKTEVNVIGQTHHRNLVRLIGFCKEEDQRLLVYEYMRNGTVADYLFKDFKPSWMARVGIAQGTARGLAYLHEECSTQIIHCDIKPQNILLDDSHNARISDFGLAKLLVLDQSQTTTMVRGTKGYVAPEWFKNKAVTVKVDVYSFGVLLLEIICCRRSVCMEIIGEERAILTDWAADCYQSGMLELLVDNDREAICDRSRFESFVMVALLCIQEEPSLRPTMKQVSQMLEGVSQVHRPLPPQDSLSVQHSSSSVLQLQKSPSI